ncbi:MULTISPECIES: type VI secretion system-associated FHA domain protein TagH [Pseudomonas]|uniref:Type VI secretion protein Fha2 n=1 Tax=Pseudomonas fluorescens (strain Q2-87) TaxID=1038922 RepID=J2XWH1_PSEFQ|nr:MULTISPECIES: type VI secretion system-associated FHA domain protein TagH [Pseudomonas]EJK99120.1 type VI secretion protein Fha2 [Pseudomonas fluorescens Q2-87]
MELVLEMLSAKQFVAAQRCKKTFGPAGGVIGRGEDCDWIIPDRQRLLSKRHAQVSFQEGAFFLTDTSGNGTTHRESGRRLPSDAPVRIQDGDAYIMGDFEILARLVCGPEMRPVDPNRTMLAGSLIPDDAFLDLDPLKALEQHEHVRMDIDALIDPATARPDIPGSSDYARIDMENLLLPKLVAAPAESVAEPAPSFDPVDHPLEDFWQRFGNALGISLESLDQEAREALAISAALLLKQSMRGVQQSLRTRSELKNELRLPQPFIQEEQENPLKSADSALQKLLLPTNPAPLSAEQLITRAFHDLQAHQVALLSASRVTLRATLEHFSPRQLILRLEREHKPLISTSGHYWKAYSRYHQALCQDEDWTDRLLVRDFAQAYEEQVRLISSLQTDYHG